MKRGALGLVVGLLLGGCAGIPDSGPVVRVEAPTYRTHSTVRYEPARPRAGATPLRIAEGYLDAMLAYPEATGIVQEFLTPQAAKDWNSGSGVVVYSSALPGLRSVSGNRAQVALRLRSSMSLDASGHATVKPSVTTRILQLARVGGQWRVDNPVPGYLISQSFARDYVRSYPLWFFDESGRRLVPEVMHAVVGEQLPITLVRRLADGPQGSSRRTFLPPAEALRLRITGNLLEIDIRRKVHGDADEIAAQVLSTLRGVPGLDEVRFLVNGQPDGKDLAIATTPVGFGTGVQLSRAYAIRKNKVVELTTRAKAMPGPWGKSAHGAIDIAVGADSVAGLMPGRGSVIVGSRTRGAIVTYDGIDFVRPLWDDSGRLWLIDNPEQARVRVVGTGEMVALDTRGLGVVQSFALSPDGTRFAAIVAEGNDAHVYVGDVMYDIDGFPRRLGNMLLVSRGLVGERQVGWASQSRVQFLADTKTTAQLHSVGIDGADEEFAAGLPMLTGGVAGWAGPAEDGAVRWALDARGRVWRLAPDENWRLVQGTSAGGAVRGLSSGR
jgi:hypothetical protein